MPIETLLALYPAEAFDTDPRLLELARLADELAAAAADAATD